MEYNVKIEGMMCGMCETHVNDAIRNNFDVKKVKSSHKKGLTTIKAAGDIDTEKLKEIIKNEGYTVTEISVMA